MIIFLLNLHILQWLQYHECTLRSAWRIDVTTTNTRAPDTFASSHKNHNYRNNTDIVWNCNFFSSTEPLRHPHRALSSLPNLKGTLPPPKNAIGWIHFTSHSWNRFEPVGKFQLGRHQSLLITFSKHQTQPWAVGLRHFKNWSKFENNPFSINCFQASWICYKFLIQENFLQLSSTAISRHSCSKNFSLLDIIFGKLYHFLLANPPKNDFSSDVH